MTKYSAIIEHCYVNFAMSKTWSQYVESIREISPAVADAINKYGIGEEITDEGQYNFQSGQLLSSIPLSVKTKLEKEIENVYDLICSLAKAYAEYVVENAY